MRAFGTPWGRRHGRGPCLAVVLTLGNLACADETVAHRQIEREANRILVALRSAGVPAHKRRDEAARELRFDVVVAASDGPRALNVLETKNLPREPATGSSDLVEAAGMITSEHDERMKQQVGLEGDIVNALREVPGVLEARAAVSMPAWDPLSGPARQAPPKASVLVIHRADGEPPVDRTAIERFVQAKLPSLDSTHVEVVMIEASRSAPSSPEAGGACRSASLLGVDVCERSRGRARTAVIALLAANAVFALAAAGLALRRRQAGSSPTQGVVEAGSVGS